MAFKDEVELDDKLIDVDAEYNSSPRWLPAIVLFIAVGGFIGLAWYAYHAGSRNTSDEDLLLVEADNAPMKEKPADPGGMKFPHQDKSVFDTIASGANKMPQGEHVMPAPEEPVKPEIKAETAKTDATPQTAEELIPADKFAEKTAQEIAEKADQKTAASKMEPPVTVKVEEKKPEVVAAKEKPAKLSDKFLEKPLLEGKPPTVQASTNVTQTEESKVTSTGSSTETKVVDTEKPKEVVKAKEAPKAAAVKPAAGGKLVQLGAYKSEAEAQGAFKAMQKKASELTPLKPAIVKADLGEKGIFYRLRVSVGDAKAFCSALTAKGQACIPVK